MPIKAIAFDLDDTLLDTTGILTPKASEHAFKILQKHGLNLTLIECENFRREKIKTTSHRDVFLQLAENFGTSQTQQAVSLANSAFYHPEIPETLPLLPGALENLQKLQQDYALYLVTAGFFEAQIGKVKALNIDPFFKKIFVVDSMKKERKYAAFSEIVKLENIQNEELLCIGNSLSSEIKDARLLGAHACFFEFGEERTQYPTDTQLQPHYKTNNHFNLIEVCQLKTK